MNDRDRDKPKPNHIKSRTKYRPVLTAVQIEHILALARADYVAEYCNDKDISFSIISSLSPFKAKIDAVAIQPAYTPTSTKVDTTLKALGESALTPPPEIPATFATKELYWEYCYLKWCTNPADCTMAELLASDEHRYLNSLMSALEVARHEQLEGDNH